MYFTELGTALTAKHTVKSRYLSTVKLGYNELGYNEHSVITNKNNYLVGLGHFYERFSRL